MIITKLKQSGFILTLESGSTIGFDLGSETPVDRVAQIAPLSAVFVSHQHGDHLNATNLSAASAPVFAASDILPLLADESLDVKPLSLGEALIIGGCSVTPFVVDHGQISAPIVNLGFLIEADGQRLLFLGDMAIPGSVPPGPYNAVLIPVGGGKVFAPEEAHNFIQTLGECGWIIPIHFDGNSSIDTARSFEKLASDDWKVRTLEFDDQLTLA